MERYSIVLTLLLPALLIGLGRGFIVPVLPIIARDEFLVTAAGAAMIFVAPMTGSMLATLPTGYLLDRIGRRIILIMGPLVTAASSFALFFASYYWEMIFYLLINGIAIQMWQMGRLTVIADTGKASQRGRMITGMAGLQRAGNLLGPFLGGVVGTFFGLRMPFVVYGLLAVVATLLMVFFIKETSPEHLKRREKDYKPEEKSNSEPNIAHSWGVMLTPPVIALFVAQITANLARGSASGNAGPAYIFAAYAYNMAAIGLGTISLVVGVIGIPMTFLAGYIMDRFGRKRAVVPAALSLGAVLVLLAITAWSEWPVWAFIVLFVLANLAVSFMSGSMQTIASDMAPEAIRGKFFGMSRLMASIGSVGNPLSFAAAVALFAAPLGYAVGFLFMGLGGIVTSLIVGKLLIDSYVPKQKNTPPSPE